MVATLPDLLRLLAVPALGWAAWRDLQVRRVPNRLWAPLAALGVALLVWEAWQVGLGAPWTRFERLYVLRAAISLGFVVPFAYLAWRFRAFGGADAKALMVLAVLFPTTPYYGVFGGLPLEPGLGAFALTVLSNTVVVAALYPVALGTRNLLAGNHALVMFVGARVPTASITDRHGSLMETPEGKTRRGLDIDALRMYLRWRDATLDELRAAPDEFRDPASLPVEPSDPTDGAIADGGVVADAERAGDGEGGDDPWGADAFLDDVPHAWGTTADGLREGLEVLTSQDEVWYSPGIPFIVPMFLGLVVALTYGDILVRVLIGGGLG